ncbi:MAG: hypothetical protein Q9171_007436 [Xanthocarpia ochracea]
MKTTMLYCAAEAVSQSKWIWFHRRPRRLIDIELYDQASRGPWGALTMLKRVRCRDMSFLAAFVIIFSLAIDPFAQQLSRLELEQVLVDDVQAEISVQWILPTRLMWDLQCAFVSALFGSKPHDTSSGCMYGNCDWSPYQSLAVCHRCRDLSNEIHINDSCFSATNGTCVAYLLNGVSMEFGLSNNYFRGTLMNTTGTGALMKTGNVGLTLVNFTKLAFNYRSVHNGKFSSVYCSKGTHQDQALTAQCVQELTGLLEASECTLSWCIKRYFAEETSGILDEFNIDSQRSRYYNDIVTDHLSGEEYIRIVQSIDAIFPRSFYSDMYTYEYPTQPCYVAHKLHVMLSRWLTKFFTTNLNFTEDSFGAQDEVQPLNPALMLYGSNMSDRQRDTVFQVFSNVAYGVTQYIRQDVSFAEGTDVYASASWLNRSTDEDGHFYAQGRTYEDRLIVRIRWGWLVFPVGLVAMTGVLSILTKIRSSRQHLPTWGSSTTALMVRGPYSHPDEISPLIDSTQQMQDKAKSAKVALERSSNGYWRLYERIDPAIQSEPTDLESATSVGPQCTSPAVTSISDLTGTGTTSTVDTMSAATQPEQIEDTTSDPISLSTTA